MKVLLSVNLLASLVGIIWCQEPERPAYNFGLRYRVYGDTKTCIVSPDGTRSCRWYQTQYFQDLLNNTNRRLRIDTNVKKFFESSFYFLGDGGFVRYRYVPSNWRTPCTRELVPIMPIQRVPISFNFNGTDTVEGRVCNVWRRDTGYNPVTTERWCIHDNNYLTPPTTEPLSFTVKRTNLTKETLWRGYTTYVDESYFKLPYGCPTLAPTVESANGDGNGNGDNSNDGGLTTEATKTTMTTKIHATTNGTKLETTTLAAETAAMQGGVGNSSENNNRANDSTMPPKTTMATKLETTTTETNNGNDDENNNSSTSTMPPKTTISTKIETEAMEVMTTMETKGDDGVENENDNNDNGSATDPVTTMATKMETTAMGEMTTITTKANDGVEYEKDDEGSTSTMPPKTIMSTEMEVTTITTTVANDGEEEEDNNNGDNGDGDDLFNTA